MKWTLIRINSKTLYANLHYFNVAVGQCERNLAGGGRSNKERQRLQLLASVTRAPLCEVRRVRYILNKEI